MIDLFKAMKRRKKQHIDHFIFSAAPATHTAAKDIFHTSRENWLREATDELRPYFAAHGYVLPEKIRFTIVFTSRGKLLHAELDYLADSERKRKKSGRSILAKCSAAGCHYKIRLSRKWANLALPFCPINPEHGRFVCTSKDGHRKTD